MCNPLFPHFSPSWLPHGTHSQAGYLLKGYLSTFCCGSIKLRVNQCGKECIIRFLEWAEVLLSRFTVLLYPGFIFCCSSNPPASLTLLCWRTGGIKTFFAPDAETHCQAIWPLVWAYLTVRETKSMSHFHCSLSLWCCEFVTACYLVSPQPPFTGSWRIRRDLGFFGTCAALWGGPSVEPLWTEEMIQMQSFWLS